jgi:hypothetical protein
MLAGNQIMFWESVWHQDGDPCTQRRYERWVIECPGERWFSNRQSRMVPALNIAVILVSLPRSKSLVPTRFVQLFCPADYNGASGYLMGDDCWRCGRRAGSTKTQTRWLSRLAGMVADPFEPDSMPAMR